MKFKNLLMALALVLSVSVAVAQPRPQQQQPQKQQPQKHEPAHSAFYRDGDVASFKTWVARELRDDFAKFKRQRIRVMGDIKVNFRVEPNGKVVALKHEDTRARNKALDRKIASTITKVLNKQKWVVKGPPKKQQHSFILNY